jgi:hypothetical protein
MYASSVWNDTVNVILMRSMTPDNTCSLPNKFYTALGQNYFQNSIPRTSKRLNLMENTELDIKINIILQKLQTLKENC